MLFCRRVVSNAAKFWLKKTVYAPIVLMKSILFPHLTAKNAATRLSRRRVQRKCCAALV